MSYLRLILASYRERKHWLVNSCSVEGIFYLSHIWIAFCSAKDTDICIFDPRGRPTVADGSDHCFCTCRPYVRTSVPTFQNKTNFKRKQCSLLAILWVWPSGSLMTPVLFVSNFEVSFPAPLRVIVCNNNLLEVKNLLCTKQRWIEIACFSRS